MIVEEFKSDSTLIRIDNKYIELEKDNKEMLKIITSLIINKTC